MAWFWLLTGLAGGGGIGYLVGWTRGHVRGTQDRPRPPVSTVLDYWPPDAGEHGTHHHICKPGCKGHGR